jgi:hypothetical protein
MRRTICTVLGCLVAISLTATPAVALVVDRDTGFDANDIPPNGHIDPDIRSTTRKLVAHDDSGRVLSIVVRFYERHGWWPLWIRLDARGGPRVDHIVSTHGDQCYVWPKGHRRDGVQVRGVAHGDRFVCRMPARLVSSTKSIRWKVRTKVPDGSGQIGTFVTDFAPSDRGWYG